MAKIYHADLWGLREGKYRVLSKTDITATDWEELKPNSPFYFFVPRHEEPRPEYEKGWKETDIFPVNSTGIVTARDSIVIDFDRHALEERLAEFANTSLGDETIRQKYFGHKRGDKYLPGDTRGWKLTEARGKLQIEQKRFDHIKPCLYRPFDIRSIYYTGYMVDWPRPEVMRHMLAGENVALCVGRAGQVIGPRTWDILLCSRLIEDFNLFYRGGNVNFPLYLYPV
jgi:predicted helicase